MLLPAVPQARKEPERARQGRFAEATTHPQRRLEQGKQTLGPMLLDLSPCLFLLRGIAIGMPRAWQRPIAAGRVRVPAPAGVDGEGRRLLPGLPGEIAGRLEAARPLAPAPGDDGRPVLGLMARPGSRCLRRPRARRPRNFFPPLRGLTLVARGVREVIGFDCAVPVTLPLLGQGGMAQPPAPAVAGPAMAA